MFTFDCSAISPRTCCFHAGQDRTTFAGGMKVFHECINGRRWVIPHAFRLACACGSFLFRRHGSLLCSPAGVSRVHQSLDSYVFVRIPIENGRDDAGNYVLCDSNLGDRISNHLEAIFQNRSYFFQFGAHCAHEAEYKLSFRKGLMQKIFSGRFQSCFCTCGHFDSRKSDPAGSNFTNVPGKCEVTSAR